jgi:hypothetical protein
MPNRKNIKKIRNIALIKYYFSRRWISKCKKIGLEIEANKLVTEKINLKAE